MTLLAPALIAAAAWALGWFSRGLWEKWRRRPAAAAPDEHAQMAVGQQIGPTFHVPPGVTSVRVQGWIGGGSSEVYRPVETKPTVIIAPGHPHWPSEPRDEHERGSA